MTPFKLMPRFNPSLVVLLALLSIALQGCFHSSSGGGGRNTPAPSDRWTWMSGSDIVNQIGVYGTKGTANSANVPGARENAFSGTDANGNFWLFGGVGYDSTGNNNRLNDLWLWNGSNWTWISGDDQSDPASSNYGTQGVADAANMPGTRSRGVSWADASGNLWLFGGRGFDSAVNSGNLNDLWRWDGSNWTWMSGSNVVDQSGVYGTQGTTDAANVPGARTYGTTWVDASGDLWLFGGGGYDSVGSLGALNGLWRWDGSNWTWVSGSNVIDQTGVYGTKGTADVANMPGSRDRGVSWVDASDNLWLFGGYGYDSGGTLGSLNDLWRWDGINWTWVSGSEFVGQPGIYGTKGTADAANVPGARNELVTWTDASGNMWLFGGIGFDSAGTSGVLNDLWQWDGNNWVWVSGSDVVDQFGTYGTQGVASAVNAPGARIQHVSWIDANDNLWFFGGEGYDSAGTQDLLNDLWRYKP